MNLIIKTIGDIAPWLFLGIILFEISVTIYCRVKSPSKISYKCINTLFDYLVMENLQN